MKAVKSLQTFFDNLNFSTFLLAALGALAALWLNTQYVSNEVYAKDQEIIRIKLESLETETQALRFMAQSNQNDIKELLPLISKIENLVANFITPSGDVILTESMKEMEVDIAEIKKDIQYMKLRLWPEERR